MFTFLVGTALFIGSIVWLARRVKRSSSIYLHYSNPIKDDTDTDTYKPSNWGASSYSSSAPSTSTYKPRASSHKSSSSSRSKPFSSGGFGGGRTGGGGSSSSW